MSEEKNEVLRKPANLPLFVLCIMGLVVGVFVVGLLNKINAPGIMYTLIIIWSIFVLFIGAQVQENYLLREARDKKLEEFLGKEPKS